MESADPALDAVGVRAMKFVGHRADYDRTGILRKAEGFRSRGRVRKAIREYEKVLAMDPQDIEVHTKVAQLYIRAGRKDQAKASLKRVIDWNESEGFLDKTIAMLRVAQSVDRRDLEVYLHLAELYLGKGVEGDALRLLEGARRAFRRKRFRKEAIAVEEKILSFAPDDFRAQVSCVWLLWRVGRKYEAEERLWQMESHWALMKNVKQWRKTRWLLCRLAPSLATGWGSFISFFTSPVPYPGKGRARVKGDVGHR
jgi:tetratricopeptide (TPR) repeat protein